MKGGSNVVIEQHRHEGVFIARGKEDALVTKNLVPGVRSAHPPSRLGDLPLPTLLSNVTCHPLSAAQSTLT